MYQLRIVRGTLLSQCYSVFFGRRRISFQAEVEFFEYVNNPPSNLHEKFVQLEDVTIQSVIFTSGCFRNSVSHFIDTAFARNILL